MIVSGFTLIRNALRYDYPIREAILSILPLCDEVVVAVGDSDDGTRDYIAAIDPAKVRILDTVWDADLRTGGQVLAVETNKALAAIRPDADWALYIQGDETLHESEYDSLRAAMSRWKDDRRVEGLVFDYRHFYGSYDYVGDSRRWYRREVRVVRPRVGIESYRDAQGFRLAGRKLHVQPAGAHVHHYGWVRHPVTQRTYRRQFGRLWHDAEVVARHVSADETHDYQDIDSLVRFRGAHPAVMRERIARQDWTFEWNERRRFKPRHVPAQWLERLTGYRIGEYKNFELI